MFRHSTNTASFLSVVIAVLMFSLSLAGVAAAQQDNTSLGTGALEQHHGRASTPPSESNALLSNTTGELQHRQRSRGALFEHHGRLQHRQRSPGAL